MYSLCFSTSLCTERRWGSSCFSWTNFIFGCSLTYGNFLSAGICVHVVSWPVLCFQK